MKKTILLTACLLFPFLSQGEMAKWLIPPHYDALFIKAPGLLQGHSKGENSLWNMKGKKIFSTAGSINPFSNGLATIQQPNSIILEGAVDPDGKFTRFNSIETAHDYPFFENEYLVAREDGRYVMLNKKGRPKDLPYLEILYPFSDKYAVYISYKDPEKKKNRFFSLVQPDGNIIENMEVEEKEKTKVINLKDINFISSIDPKTGKALAVVKNKLYWFSKSSKHLVPIMMEDSKEKMKQLELQSGKSLSEIEFPTDSLSIIAKCGKDKTVEYRFDKLLRLLPEGASAAVSNRQPKQLPSAATQSMKNAAADGDLYGLTFGDYTLPSQFSQVSDQFDNKAIVELDGKWGVVEINHASDYTLRIKGVDELQFRHKNFNGQLQLGVPVDYPVKNVTLEVADASGLHIDKAFDVYETYDEEKYFTFPFTLDIPESLTDSVTDISVGPVSVKLDGLRLPARPINVKAKYAVPFKVSFPSNADVSSGKCVFSISVNSEVEDSLLAIPYEVNVTSKNLPVMIEKISDNGFRCTVDSLQEGKNNINISVTENGCPTVSFPTVINYANSPKKETAIIRDKSIDDILTLPKRVTFNDGWFAGEVMVDQVSLRKGPGPDYPVATFKTDYGEFEWFVYKHKRYKIREEGDWYKVDMDNDPSTEDQAYILKDNMKPVESTSFLLEEYAAPAVYLRYEEESGKGETEDHRLLDVFTIYPEGLYVRYLESFEGGWVQIGALSTGDPALIPVYGFDIGNDGDNKNITEPNLGLTKGIFGKALVMNLPKSAYKSTTYRKNKIVYPDVTVFSAQDWLDFLQKEIKNFEKENRIQEFELSTKDELVKGYERIK